MNMVLEKEVNQTPAEFDLMAARFTLSAVDAPSLDLALIGLQLANMNHKRPVLGFYTEAPVIEEIASVDPQRPASKRHAVRGWLNGLDPANENPNQVYRSTLAQGGGITQELAAFFERPGLARLELEVTCDPAMLDDYGMMPNAARLQAKTTLEIAQTEIDKINPRLYHFTGGELFVRWAASPISDKNKLSVTGLIITHSALNKLRQ